MSFKTSALPTQTLWSLTDKDLATLAQVHPRMEAAVKELARICPVRFTVFEGLRTVARQQKLVREGKSKTMNSKHLTGLAVDLVPVLVKSGRPTPVWDAVLCTQIAHWFFEVVGDGADFTWGGTWANTDNAKHKAFFDAPHFQIAAAPVPRTHTTQGVRVVNNVTRTKDIPAADVPSAGWTIPPATDLVRDVQLRVNTILRRTASEDMLLKVDGRMGPDTIRKIRIAQETIGVTADGLWGPASTAAAERYLATHAEKLADKLTIPLGMYTTSQDGLIAAGPGQPLFKGFNFKDFNMSGSKTYIALIVAVAVAVLEGALGVDVPGVDFTQNWGEIILAAMGAGGFRSAMASAASSSKTGASE